MSDETATPGRGTNGGTGPEAATTEETAPPMVVTHQYVKDLSFENPSSPEVFLGQSGAPEVGIAVNVQAQRLAEDAFEVVLHVEARADLDGKPVFIVELDYAGLVHVDALPEERLRPLVMIEAPRLLFPFARAIVAEVTRDGGFPSLVLAPVDFEEIYRRGIEQEAPDDAGR